MSDTGSFESSEEPSGSVRMAFWSLVVLVDVAMLATALGLMLIFLGDRPRLGTSSLIVGVLGFALAYGRVRARRNA